METMLGPPCDQAVWHMDRAYIMTVCSGSETDASYLVTTCGLWSYHVGHKSLTRAVLHVDFPDESQLCKIRMDLQSILRWYLPYLLRMLLHCISVWHVR